MSYKEEGLSENDMRRGLVRFGLSPADVMMCPVEQNARGTLIYYREFRLGKNMTRMGARYFNQARRCKSDLIGFMFHTGEIRSDRDIFVDGIFGGGVAIPRYVVFYKPSVPARLRSKLAAHPNRAGSADRPRIIVPGR